MKMPISLLAILSCFHATAFATILISDDFDLSAGTVIDGTAPDITVNGAAWAANASYASNGSAVRTSGTNGREAGLDLGTGFFITNPGISELRADVFFAASGSPGTTWYAIGFTQTNTTALNTSYASTNSNGGSPFMLLRDNGQVGVFSGPGATGLLNPASPAGQFPNGNAYALQLVLDTTVLNWTLDAYVDSTQIDLNGAGTGNTFTYTANPTLRFVGFSSSTGFTTATLDNFQLSVVAIPEVGTWMLGLGCVLAAFCSRRARRLRKSSELTA